MNAATSKFDTWALVEIMGHQKAAGRVTEAPVGGGVMLRIDIPKDADSQEFITQYVNTGSIFRLTPVTEEIVRAALRASVGVWLAWDTGVISDEAPFVPSWCYAKGPRMCPCGHHEGYHADEGWCLLAHKCGCQGLPADCCTPLGDS